MQSPVNYDDTPYGIIVYGSVSVNVYIDSSQ